MTFMSMKQILLFLLLSFCIQTTVVNATNHNIMIEQSTIRAQDYKIEHNFNNYNKTLSINSNVRLESISVFNILGQESYKSKINSFSSKINLSSLNKGIYIAKIISTKKSSKTIKLIIR